MRELCLALGVVLLLGGCELKSEYAKEVEESIAAGKRNDSLFLNLSLRMSAKDFYATCWELNKQGLIKQGPGNKSVQYKMTDEFEYPVYMRFYPEFTDDGNIWKMPVDFLYEAWAPWNKQLSADSLMPKVVDLFEDWYGGEFKEEVNEKTGQRVYYKIDGNRQTLIFKRDSSRVSADISDIFLVNPLNKDE
jgi:hypothetical protein